MCQPEALVYSASRRRLFVGTCIRERGPLQPGFALIVGAKSVPKRGDSQQSSDYVGSCIWRGVLRRNVSSAFVMWRRSAALGISLGLAIDAGDLVGSTGRGRDSLFSL